MATISTETALRDIVGTPNALIAAKVIDVIRSDLWNPDRHVDRSELPSSGAIYRSVADPDLDVETYDRERDARYARREGLY